MLVKDVLQSSDGTKIDSCFYVKHRTQPRSYYRGYMFDVVLSDKTGDIDLVYFGGDDENKVNDIFSSFSIGDIVKVIGVKGIYSRTGKAQIQIGDRTGGGEIRPADEDEFEIGKFIVPTNQDPEDMLNYITNLMGFIDNEYLESLLNKFFDDEEFVDKFKTHPGSRLYHHACKGGLLEHTWEMLQYCEKAIDIHPSLDGDLIIAGAILHDIGKIRENIISLSIKETREGMLLEHIFIGAAMIREKILEINDFPQLLADKLLHIVLSHHEKKEYGSPVEPKTPEAITVANSDMIGSKVSQYIRAKKDSVNGDFKTWRKPIGWVFIE